jgi:hypothetical protein
VNASASKPGIGGAQIAFRLALEMRLISWMMNLITDGIMAVMRKSRYRSAGRA